MLLGLLLAAFMSQEEYDHCVDNMRHKGTGLLFGLPVVMDTSSETLKAGDHVLLTYKGQNIAVMKVGSSRYWSCIYQ